MCETPSRLDSFSMTRRDGEYAARTMKDALMAELRGLQRGIQETKEGNQSAIVAGLFSSTSAKIQALLDGLDRALGLDEPHSQHSRPGILRNSGPQKSRNVKGSASYKQVRFQL